MPNSDDGDDSLTLRDTYSEPSNVPFNFLYQVFVALSLRMLIMLKSLEVRKTLPKKLVLGGIQAHCKLASKALLPLRQAELAPISLNRLL